MPSNSLIFIGPEGLIGLFGNSVLLNEFKKGPHRLEQEDSIALSQLSNQLTEVTTVGSAIGPLAIVGFVKAGLIGKETIKACGKIIFKK